MCTCSRRQDTASCPFAVADRMTVYRRNVDLLGRARRGTVYRYSHAWDPRVCLYRDMSSENGEFHVSSVNNSSLTRTVKPNVDNPEAPRRCGDTRRCELACDVDPAAHSKRTTLHGTVRCNSPHPPPFQTAHRSPAPPPLATPIAMRDTVADRNGGRHFPSARRRRCTCQSSCRHPCSAGPKLCGPRRRDRGEVNEDAKCPPRHETRRQSCALCAKIGTITSPHMGKTNASGSVLSGLQKDTWARGHCHCQSRHEGARAYDGERVHVGGRCAMKSCMAVHGWFDGRSCLRLMAIEILRF